MPVLPAALTSDSLRRGLSTRTIGSEIECHASLTSTQDRARELAAAGAPHGTTVFAEAQTAGRGRHGRAWVSAPGLGIWCSVIVCPDWPRARDMGLTAAAACAVADALDREAGLRPGLRWPNDVMIGDKKIAGVLVEIADGPNGRRVAIVGAGLNCGHRAADFPPELRDEATSIRHETRRVPDRARMARAYLASLERWLDVLAGPDPSTLAAAWSRRIGIVGRRVIYCVAGEERCGLVEEVDLFTGLVVAEDVRGRTTGVRRGSGAREARRIWAEHIEWLRLEEGIERRRTPTRGSPP